MTICVFNSFLVVFNNVFLMYIAFNSSDCFCCVIMIVKYIKRDICSRACVYQGVKMLLFFSENFPYVLNVLSHIWLALCFCHIAVSTFIKKTLQKIKKCFHTNKKFAKQLWVFVGILFKERCSTVVLIATQFLLLVPTNESNGLKYKKKT